MNSKKNEEADHLIKVVGIETQNVSQEKTAADEEKIKVDQINIDVRAKQIDCEQDLKKAEPALIAAQDALNTLNKVWESFSRALHLVSLMPRRTSQS